MKKQAIYLFIPFFLMITLIFGNSKENESFEDQAVRIIHQTLIKFPYWKEIKSGNVNFYWNYNYGSYEIDGEDNYIMVHDIMMEDNHKVRVSFSVFHSKIDECDIYFMHTRQTIDLLHSSVNIEDRPLVLSILGEVEREFNEIKNDPETIEELGRMQKEYKRWSKTWQEELEEETWIDRNDAHFCQNRSEIPELSVQLVPRDLDEDVLDSLNDQMKKHNVEGCSISQIQAAEDRQGITWKFRVSNVTRGSLFSSQYLNCTPLMVWGEADGVNYGVLCHVDAKTVSADSLTTEYFYKILKERHYAMMDSLGHCEIYYFFLGSQYYEEEDQADTSMIGRFKFLDGIIRRIRGKGIDKILIGPNPVVKGDQLNAMQSVLVFPQERRVVVQKFIDRGDIFNEGFSPGEMRSMMQEYHKQYRKLQ